MKNLHTPNFTWIGSWEPEICPHEYLISPIEINVNWPGSQQLWTSPIYTDFSGANSCSHILGPINQFLPNLGFGSLFIMLYGILRCSWYSKRWNIKIVFLWRHHFGTLLSVWIKFLQSSHAVHYCVSVAHICKGDPRTCAIFILASGSNCLSLDFSCKQITGSSGVCLLHLLQPEWR